MYEMVKKWSGLKACTQKVDKVYSFKLAKEEYLQSIP